MRKMAKKIKRLRFPIYEGLITKRVLPNFEYLKKSLKSF